MAAKTIPLDKVPAKLARAVKAYGIDRDHARAMFWLGLAGDRDMINVIRELTGLEFENARPDGEPANAVDDETVLLQRLASLLWCDEDGAEAQANAEAAASAIAVDAAAAMQQPDAGARAGRGKGVMVPNLPKHPALPLPPRAWGYVRVSTDKSGLSIDEQQTKIHAHCAENGWQLERIFVDAGVSGGVPR